MQTERGGEGRRKEKREIKKEKKDAYWKRREKGDGRTRETGKKRRRCRLEEKGEGRRREIGKKRRRMETGR
jgi:hypothetical protein